MKFIKQPDKISIVNIDNLITSKFEGGRKHGNLLPESIRSIICGRSNCGKTNVMLNLLFSPKGLYFENVYLFSKSLNQSKYTFLQNILEDVPEVGYFSFSDNDHVPPPNEILKNSIVIFDDVACEKQNNIRDYFSRGRHNHADSFYICQTYSYIPKQLIRDNTNFLIIFKQDNRNLTHIYNDHVNMDMELKQFRDMCRQIWLSGENKFVVIDRDRDLNDGRYREGFDVFIKF